MAETVIIRFRGEDNLTPVANKVADSVSKVDDSAKSAGKGFSALGEIAVGALRGIGELALDVGKNALSGAFDFFKTAVEGSAEYQSALAQTEAVIASTGMAAGFTAQDMEKLARGLSAVSGQSLFTDDQLLGAQNVLATFTNIQGINFSSATQAIADLSQAMGQDLQSSAVQVGKALNDPVQGITALQRVGVSFTEEQKRVVESLVEMGDTSEAQRLILKELERQFGGSAAAAAQTFSGQMTVMTEQIEDAKGAIGDALLPLLTEMVGIFGTHLLPTLRENTASIGAFFQGISDSGGVMATIDGIKASFQRLVASNPILQRLIVLGNEVSATFATLYAGITELAADPALQKWGGFALQILEKVALVIIDSLVLAFQVLRFTLGIVVDGIKIFASAMEPIWSVVYPKIVAVLTAISQLLRGDFAGAWQTVKNIVVTAWTELYDAVSRVITNLYNRVRNFIGDILSTVIDIGKNIVNGIAAGITQAKASVEKALKSVMDAAIQKIKDTLGISSSTVIDIGKNIVNGIAAGITQAKASVEKALKSVIDAAIQKIKDTLGISSPSKTMASIIGVPMVQGIISGSATGIQRAAQAPSAEASQTVQNFYLTANYQTTQSQSSIRNDLRAMQLLAGGVA